MNGAIDRYITNIYIYIITVKIICTMLQDVKNHNEFGEISSPKVFLVFAHISLFSDRKPAIS